MSPRWAHVGRTVLLLLWVVVRLTLIVALASRSAAQFVYAGF